MSKKIIKRCVYLFLCLLSVFVFWIGFAYFHDEAPDKGRDEFYSTSNVHIPDNQNAATALAGFDAPIGVDILKHGRFVVDTFNNAKTDDDPKKITETAGMLSFVGDREEFECWIYDSIKKTSDNCSSPERIKTLLSENKELLERYKSLYSLPSWQGMSGNGQYIINLNKLISAEIKLDIAEGKPEIAFKKWLDNFQFISHAVGQEANSIDRAIFLVADGMCIRSLEYILFKSPEISTQHFDELTTALKPSGLERYNLAGMIRADYSFINEKFILKTRAPYFHPEFIRNRFYRYQTDYLNKAQKPPSTFANSQNELAKKYEVSAKNLADDWLDPLNSSISKHLLGGQLKSFALSNAMHEHNALIKLLNLSVKIRQQKIAYADIQPFLDHAVIDYNNPFTNRPMSWDFDKKVLYFESLDRNYRPFEVRLN